MVWTLGGLYGEGDAGHINLGQSFVLFPGQPEWKEDTTSGAGKRVRKRKRGSERLSMLFLLH